LREPHAPPVYSRADVSLQERSATERLREARGLDALEGALGG
jgi:hypothetical protein